ncbi:hypothetical protein PQE75_gp131 [Bacillus phage vB_BcoS-136]|uniref:Uncharacterized protein n=1 Tax=Bacillus phage vB_BcoS-136 TaxID=2419619 RepID=A0A3G3BVR1_9CAUD|nr:hypothetical protein PQE75_gp131 [Bacillus phage vB_BcoS-136]AYP68348.1 hypothetical protein vBBcoS136_00234 [Bacillus phage vB_BcoS-136]
MRDWVLGIVISSMFISMASCTALMYKYESEVKIKEIEMRVDND